MQRLMFEDVGSYARRDAPAPQLAQGAVEMPLLAMYTRGVRFVTAGSTRAPYCPTYSNC